jgi:hypothetical protein
MRNFLLFVGGCAAAFMAVLLFRGEAGLEQSNRAEMVAAMRDEVPGPRISYAPGHYPQLNLPDGRKATIKSLLNMDKPMRFGSHVWNDRGVGPGQIWVRIDLGRQLLSVFRDGHEIGTTVILFGTDGKATPVGAFTIQAMQADYHSRTYDAPMPYMLRLTDDGVAIHGSNVRNGSATHGCIGVPRDFAQLLFAQAKVGDLVYILPAGRSSDKS